MKLDLIQSMIFQNVGPGKIPIIRTPLEYPNTALWYVDSSMM